MIFETIFQNDYGSEIDLPSPQQGHRFKIAEGDRQVYKSNNPLGVFSRYSRIIFLKAHEQFVETTQDPSLKRRKLLWRGLKLIVRKGWTEPSRPWPQIWMLNKSDVPLQVISPDMFDQNNKVFLFWDLPTLVSVPPYSTFAEYRKYILGVPDQQAKQMLGASPGNFDLLENTKLEGKRSDQELRRLKKMLDEWRETQKNTIKLM